MASSKTQSTRPRLEYTEFVNRLCDLVIEVPSDKYSWESDLRISDVVSNCIDALRKFQNTFAILPATISLCNCELFTWSFLEELLKVLFRYGKKSELRDFAEYRHSFHEALEPFMAYHELVQTEDELNTRLLDLLKLGSISNEFARELQLHNTMVKEFTLDHTTIMPPQITTYLTHVLTRAITYLKIATAVRRGGDDVELLVHRLAIDRALQVVGSYLEPKANCERLCEKLRKVFKFPVDEMVKLKILLMGWNHLLIRRKERLANSTHVGKLYGAIVRDLRHVGRALRRILSEEQNTSSQMDEPPEETATDFAGIGTLLTVLSGRGPSRPFAKELLANLEEDGSIVSQAEIFTDLVELVERANPPSELLSQLHQNYAKYQEKVADQIEGAAADTLIQDPIAEFLTEQSSISPSNLLDRTKKLLTALMPKGSTKMLDLSGIESWFNDRQKRASQSHVDAKRNQLREVIFSGEAAQNLSEEEKELATTRFHGSPVIQAAVELLLLQLKSLPEFVRAGTTGVMTLVMYEHLVDGGVWLDQSLARAIVAEALRAIETAVPFLQVKERRHISKIQVKLEDRFGPDFKTRLFKAELLDAVRRDDVGTLEYILKDKSIITGSLGQRNLTLLHHAVLRESLNVFTYLLDHSYFVVNVSVGTQTLLPLHLAAFLPFGTPFVAELVRRGANVNRQTGIGHRTPLQLAQACNNDETVRLLEEAQNSAISGPVSEAKGVASISSEFTPDDFLEPYDEEQEAGAREDLETASPPTPMQGTGEAPPAEYGIVTESNRSDEQLPQTKTRPGTMDTEEIGSTSTLTRQSVPVEPHKEELDTVTVEPGPRPITIQAIAMPCALPPGTCDQCFLHATVAGGDKTKIETILTPQGNDTGTGAFDPLHLDRRGFAALHYVALSETCVNRPEVLELLLNYYTSKAVLLVQDRDGNTLLHLATKLNRVALVAELTSPANLENLAHVNLLTARNKSGWLPIHFAAKCRGNMKILKKLIGPSPRAHAPGVRSPVQVAAAQCSVEALKLFREHGYSFDAHDGKSPLELVIETGDSDDAAACLEFFLDIHANDDDAEELESIGGESLLHTAARCRSPVLLEKLLNHDVHLGSSWRNATGETPLHILARSSEPEAVSCTRLLLDLKYHDNDLAKVAKLIREKDRTGRTALDICCEQRNMTVAGAILMETFKHAPESVDVGTHYWLQRDVLAKIYATIPRAMLPILDERWKARVRTGAGATATAGRTESRGQQRTGGGATRTSDEVIQSLAVLVGIKTDADCCRPLNLSSVLHSLQEDGRDILEHPEIRRGVRKLWGLLGVGRSVYVSAVFQFVLLIFYVAAIATCNCGPLDEVCDVDVPWCFVWAVLTLFLALILLVKEGNQFWRHRSTQDNPDSHPSQSTAQVQPAAGPSTSSSGVTGLSVPDTEDTAIDLQDMAGTNSLPSDNLLVGTADTDTEASNTAREESIPASPTRTSIDRGVVIQTRWCVVTLHSRWLYFKSVYNWFQLFFGTVAVVTMCVGMGTGQARLRNAFWVLSIVGLPLGWILAMLQLRKIPETGYFISLFIQVSWKTSNMVLLFVPATFIAFAQLFRLVVPAGPFQDLPLFGVPVKLLAMFIGELTFDETIEVLQPKSDGTGTAEATQAPEVSRVSYYLTLFVFTLFACVATIVLLNLLLAIAVDITQGVKKKAAVEIVTIQLEQIGKWETWHNPWCAQLCRGAGGAKGSEPNRPAPAPVNGSVDNSIQSGPDADTAV